MRLIGFFIITFLLLSACATRPISNAEALVTPGERILDTQFLRQAPGTGEVTVKRDSGAFGSVCSSRIFVDGRPVADIRVSEKVVLYLPEGEHILSVRSNGICFNAGMSEVTVLVRSGVQSSFGVGYGSSGDIFINTTAF
ncbi:MAG: hypothetical protein HY349_06790 [Nitrospirae bacterium]|nr:hypothetical protein [Nitrospirota bacterium]